MKNFVAVLLSIILVAAVSIPAQELTPEKKEAAVNNLTVGVNSDNSGLRASSACQIYRLIEDKYLKDADASKAMIPLLNMLENGTSEDERIAAAVALYKLGNAIGIYRLRGVALFDSNERVGMICKNLYYTYHKLNNTEYYIDF